MTAHICAVEAGSECTTLDVRGDDFDCVQLIWTDRDGRFPWQQGYATEFIEAQPDLTDDAWSGFARIDLCEH
jgi:hypothetical protein